MVGGGDGTAGGGEAQGGYVVVDEDLLDGGGHRLPGGGVPGGDGAAPQEMTPRQPSEAKDHAVIPATTQQTIEVPGVSWAVVGRVLF